MNALATEADIDPTAELLSDEAKLTDAILDFLYDEPQPLGAVIGHIRATCNASSAGPLNDTIASLDALIQREWVTIRQDLLCLTPVARRQRECAGLTEMPT